MWLALIWIWLQFYHVSFAAPDVREFVQPSHHASCFKTCHYNTTVSPPGFAHPGGFACWIVFCPGVLQTSKLWWVPCMLACYDDITHVGMLWWVPCMLACYDDMTHVGMLWWVPCMLACYAWWVPCISWYLLPNKIIKITGAIKCKNWIYLKVIEYYTI